MLVDDALRAPEGVWFYVNNSGCRVPYVNKREAGGSWHSHTCTVCCRPDPEHTWREFLEHSIEPSIEEKAGLHSAEDKFKIDREHTYIR